MFDPEIIEGLERCHTQTMSTEHVLPSCTYNMQYTRLTNDRQAVYVADSGFYVRVVLYFGHTLQCASVVRLDQQREGCKVPSQGGVVTQRLVAVSHPRRGQFVEWVFFLLWFSHCTAVVGFKMKKYLLE